MCNCVGSVRECVGVGVGACGECVCVVCTCLSVCVELLLGGLATASSIGVQKPARFA